LILPSASSKSSGSFSLLFCSATAWLAENEAVETTRQVKVHLHGRPLKCRIEIIKCLLEAGGNKGASWL
jgi:hypothetical protein